MFELIGSEASYLRSLTVAVSHFFASETLKQTLSKTEHHILFSNIRHVMAASEKFLTDLENRLGECVLISEVGDIVLQHCRRFHGLYVPYVTNMMYQETLIKQQLHFMYALKKLESDPVCQRQTLKSFLVLPFQRITLLNSALQYFSILKHTIQSVFCPFVKRCLAFRDQRFVVEDHAEFITHVTVKTLNTEILGLPPNSFLLHLAESHSGQPTALILVAQTK
uniref:DH domain-containing protein n=1 Tax=Salarias fasciatus TaxID=181472 RepID=A0A672GT58_SALFA